MEQFGESYESIFDVKKRFEQKNPDFIESWKQFIKEVGFDFINEIKDKMNIEYDFLNQLLNFRFKLVIDNNFIFGQIKGTLNKKGDIEKSFLFKLLSSKSVQIFAPPKLQEELNDKILSVLKHEDQELAFKYAGILLSNITIKDAQWINEWKKASQLIRDTDPDDIPYLALAFEVQSHGILSFDQVFLKQGERKVWKFGDTDRIITNYQSGVMAFAVGGAAIHLFGYILTSIAHIVWESILILVDVVKFFASATIDTLSQIPAWVWIVLGSIGISIVAINDTARAKGIELVNNIKDQVLAFIEKLKNFILSLADHIEAFINMIEPHATPTLEFLAFLASQFLTMHKELSELEPLG
ncbi:MAG: PIN domain-containing protein [Cyclobacteriaceae bacterium]